MIAYSLLELLSKSCLKYGNRDAFLYGDTKLTYSDFDDTVKRLASGFAKRRFKRGDRVALMLPNLPQFPITYYALLRLGITVVPINTLHKVEEIRYILQETEVKGCIAWEGFAADILQAARNVSSLRTLVILREARQQTKREANLEVVDFSELIESSKTNLAEPDLNPDDPAVILYTAGTTGPAKGAILSNASLTASVISCWKAFHINTDHRFATALPLCHGFGQMLSMHLPLAAGASSVLLPRFDAGEVITTIREKKSYSLYRSPFYASGSISGTDPKNRST